MKSNQQPPFSCTGYFDPPEKLPRGEAFDLMKELDRLIDWTLKYRPEVIPHRPITVPDRFKGVKILILLEKFATFNEEEKTFYYRSFPLKFRSL